MPHLIAQKNQIEYIGAYARPPFALWGEGQLPLEGLYDAFAGFKIGLKDFRVEGNGEDPSSQAVKVHFGLQGHYRFKFDRVESAFYDVSSEDLRVFPSLLEQGAGWIRRSVPEFRFQSHLFGYASHWSLSEGTSEEVLSQMTTPDLGIGKNRGSGIIFHADLPDLDGRLQLTVDHSLFVNDGLFVNMVLINLQDQIDYSATLSMAEDLLRRSLQRLGLTLPEENSNGDV